jgi:hypothetical protein
MSLRLYLLVSEESQFYKRKGVASCFPKMAFSRFIPFTGGVDHESVPKSDACPLQPNLALTDIGWPSLHTFGDFSLPRKPVR